ncbi:hypothetical protein L1987_14642 [Smallanthus sonchifolius]|uniref:Uncharacterized protein n=1 Tax=Smallanthus sonchifolius TaxID=185202 RepID=A0ACB9J6W1_9ASTR|nr:hypothetical protein L1987_14642 [Smallanthus sonchifolius]
MADKSPSPSLSSSSTIYNVIKCVVNEGVSLVQQKNKILGSRPPGCVNKCMKCSPCLATLVIPPHHKMVDYRDQSSHGEDDCYYLLSWKCKCGDKLFQP